MNISPLTIYLWQLADGVSHTSCFLACIAGLFSAILFIAYFVARVCDTPDPEDAKDDPQLRMMRRIAYWLFPVFFLLVIMANLVPTSKTVAMMVIIPEIAHSKVVQQDLPDIYNAAVKALKDQLAK